MIYTAISTDTIRIDSFHCNLLKALRNRKFQIQQRELCGHIPTQLEALHIRQQESNSPCASTFGNRFM